MGFFPFLFCLNGHDVVHVSEALNETEFALPPLHRRDAYGMRV